MADPVAVVHRRLVAAEARVVELEAENALLRQVTTELTAEARVAECVAALEAENALLRRALSMLTRSLEDEADPSCPRPE